MRIVSHTCSNTEIVCALGAADLLVGVDSDSDHPPEVVASLPRLGRDLELDVERVAALQPDLVLSSLTVPGHERIVEALRARGLDVLVCSPQSLDEVWDDILRIGRRIGRPAQAGRLVDAMREQMPPRRLARRPRIAVEWWPKPVILAGDRSWAADLIRLAGGDNATDGMDQPSVPLEPGQAVAAEGIALSWCGVRVDKYRPELVRRRPGWQQVPAVRHDRIAPISEAFLGRPGPRLTEGYRALCTLIDRCLAD